MRDLHETGMSHDLFSASLNAYFKVDLCSERVCSRYLSCFFPLVGVQEWKDVLVKEGLF